MYQFLGCPRQEITGLMNWAIIFKNPFSVCRKSSVATQNLSSNICCQFVVFKCLFSNCMHFS